MLDRVSLARGLGALVAIMAAGAFPASASAILQDAYPTPQAIAAHAEFLSQLPAPPSGAGAVCVIDTGVTPLPDTASQIVERIAIDGGSPDDVYHDPADPTSGHGSFVAGTIASQVDGVGSAGIWPAAKIVSVRVFSQRGRGATAADYRSAIQACQAKARRFDIRVINVSLGAAKATSEELADLEERVNTAARSELSIVASAGNEGASSLTYPARFAPVVAVAAGSTDGALCPFSNRGEGLDLVALGCDASATQFDGSTAPMAGTSFSSPVVSAVLLALRSYRPELTARAAEGLLLATARPQAGGAMTIDATAAFRSAGLTSIVDSYVPISAVTAPLSPESSRLPATSVVSTRRPGAPARPRLVSDTWRRGQRRMRVTRPHRGSTAIFRTHGRTYRRSDGRLVSSAAMNRTVIVLIQDEWGQQSPLLRIKAHRKR